jgi:hypothetical protein
VATVRFTLVNEISTFEIGREADNVQGAVPSLRHFISLFRCE